MDRNHRVQAGYQMRVEWEALQEIKAVLKKFPRGLTISRIATEINSNRNTVARYLDVLQISGQVEMEPIGPAKVYILSDRIPLDSLMNICSDAILILDKEERAVEANDQFLKISGMKKEQILNSTIDIIDLPEIIDLEFPRRLIDALAGKKYQFETTYPTKTGVKSFIIQIVPTTLENGEPGAAILINDISEQKNAQDKIKETFDILELIMEGVNSSICVVDFETNEIIYANYVALSAFGCSKGNLCWQHTESTKEKFCAREQLFDLESHGIEGKKGFSYFQFAADKSIWSYQDHIKHWHDGRISRIQISNEVKKA
ncbi:MAG: PAS domain-containing protein [Candidatus Thorarchaeota archaeon]